MQHEEFESNKIPLNGNTLKFITPRPTVKSEDELKIMTPWEQEKYVKTFTRDYERGYLN